MYKPLLKKYAKLLIIIVLSGVGEWASAQDLHFSQFYNAPLNLSPALAGVFSGDQRFGANYRQQWSSVPVPYMTLSGYYDQKIYLPQLRTGLLGGGVVFNYDRAGDGNLSWAQLGLNGAYVQQIAEKHYLSAGFEAMAGQRAFDPQKLYFDDQYNGDTFNPNQASDESFPRTSTTFIDLTAGLNWYFQNDENRTRLYGGFSFAHLNQPKVGFFNDSSVKLPMQTRFYGMTVIHASEKWDAIFNGLWQIEGPSHEGIFGVGARYHLLTTGGNDTALQLGISRRLEDAWVAHVELFYGAWHAGLSYDINTSSFQTATNRNGGPELSLRYIITKVKPPEAFKSCPVF